MSNEPIANTPYAPICYIPESDCQAKYPILLVCEHASNAIPHHLGRLGLSPEEQRSHIAWDLNAYDVAVNMYKILNSTLIASSVSRLVYDCNRPPQADDAIPSKIEFLHVAGNENLSESEIRDRVCTYYNPFCDLLTNTIATALVPPVLISIHSFTPVYMNKKRTVELGILHDTDSRLADKILKLATKYTNLNTRRNEPYNSKDGVMHTLKVHGINNGLLNVMIEIRSDLISHKEQQQNIATMLSQLLVASLSALDDTNVEKKCRV